MREILFKAKRLSDGAWVEGFPYWGEYSGAFILQNKTYSRRNARTFEISMGDNVVPIEVDPSTVCQYTGLKDKNGKRIFEGDNVYDPHENSIYTVEWNENNAIFQMAHDWRRRSVETAYYCEIIGNIYDGEGGQHEGAEHD